MPDVLLARPVFDALPSAPRRRLFEIGVTRSYFSTRGSRVRRLFRRSENGRWLILRLNVKKKKLSVHHYSQTRRPWQVFQLLANAANTVRPERGHEASGPSHSHSGSHCLMWRRRKIRRGATQKRKTFYWLLFGFCLKHLDGRAGSKKKICCGVVIWRNERFLETLMPRLSFF